MNCSVALFPSERVTALETFWHYALLASPALVASGLVVVFWMARPAVPPLRTARLHRARRSLIGATHLALGGIGAALGYRVAQTSECAGRLPDALTRDAAQFAAIGAASAVALVHVAVACGLRPGCALALAVVDAAGAWVVFAADAWYRRRCIACVAPLPALQIVLASATVGSLLQWNAPRGGRRWSSGGAPPAPLRAPSTSSSSTVAACAPAVAPFSRAVFIDGRDMTRVARYSP